MVNLLDRPSRQTIARRLLLPSRKKSRGLAIVVIAGIATSLMFLVMIVGAAMTMFGPIGGQQQRQNPDCGTGGELALGPGAAGASGGLSTEQQNNAKAIIATGKKLNVPEYGWVVAIATASQESTLRNLSYGDRDSVGLFQQRTAWGSYADRMDPEKSAAMFYNGGAQGQSGLLDIKGWEKMPVTVAAQTVQRSAFPDAYADDEPLARDLVAKFGGVEVTGGCGSPPTADCPTTPFKAAESGLTPDALLVLRCTFKEYPTFKTFYGVGQRPAGGDGDHANGRAVDMMIPYGDYQSKEAKAYGWKVANWLKTNREKLGVKYLIYDRKIWSVRRDKEGWRPYSHYSGCSSNTCLHLDHIHASVYGNSATAPTAGDWELPMRKGDYALTAKFGACSSHWSNCHTGLDFAARSGTPILAASGGRVVSATRTDGPYGNVIVIDHGRGVQTLYAHMSSFVPEIRGKTVRGGWMIGEVGDTGNTTGPHLHFEVRVNGKPVDPEKWLADHGVDP